MARCDTLRHRIRICRAILILQIVVELPFFVAAWNPPDMHRHLFHLLLYASLFIQAGLALILGKRISEAKEELGTLKHSDDL